MTTWTAVTQPSTTYGEAASPDGYMVVDYIDDNYYEDGQTQWTVANPSAVVWS